jgi:hypothetical protein
MMQRNYFIQHLLLQFSQWQRLVIKRQYSTLAQRNTDVALAIEKEYICRHIKKI